MQRIGWEENENWELVFLIGHGELMKLRALFDLFFSIWPTKEVRSLRDISLLGIKESKDRLRKRNAKLSDQCLKYYLLLD